MLRAAYGYTDWQITEHIIRYGMGWLEQSLQFIVEDRARDMEWALFVAPVARTPMDKQTAHSANRYFKQLRAYVDSLIPGRKQAEKGKWERLKRQADVLEAKLGGKGRTDSGPR